MLLLWNEKGRMQECIEQHTFTHKVRHSVYMTNDTSKNTFLKIV